MEKVDNCDQSFLSNLLKSVTYQIICFEEFRRHWSTDYFLGNSEKNFGIGRLLVDK